MANESLKIDHLQVRLDSLESLEKVLQIMDYQITSENEKCTLFTEEYDLTSSLMLQFRTYCVRIMKIKKQVQNEQEKHAASTAARQNGL